MISYITFRLIREMSYLDYPHGSQKLGEIQVSFCFDKLLRFWMGLNFERLCVEIIFIVYQACLNHVVLRAGIRRRYTWLRCTVECLVSTW